MFNLFAICIGTISHLDLSLAIMSGICLGWIVTLQNPEDVVGNNRSALSLRDEERKTRQLTAR